MKIITTIDFSTTAESILRNTAIYAKAFNAEVFLVHAEPEAFNDDATERDLTQEAVRLKKDALALERAGVNVTPHFLKGPICKTIMDEALELKADLIIMGAHGHGAHCKSPVGSTSECVLLRSKVPVLIIPSER